MLKKSNKPNRSLRIEFKNLIFNIKRALLDKKSYIVVYITHGYNLKMIQEIYKLGFIEGYTYNGKYLFIKLSTFFAYGHHDFYYATDTISNLKNMPRNHSIYKAKHIRKYMQVGGHHKIAFFNTDKGILNSYQASKNYFVGGQPLFQVK